MNQIFVPMLAYENGVAALEWLRDVFGMEIKEKWLDDDGRLSHGELEYLGQRIMLAEPTPQYQNPKTVRESYPPAAELAKVPYVMNGVLIYVKDLNAVTERAIKHGGTALSEIETGFPGTRIRIEDPEGQRWFVIEME